MRRNTEGKQDMKRLIAMGVVAASMCVFAEEKSALADLLTAAKNAVTKNAAAESASKDSGLEALNKQIQELTEKINGAKSASGEKLDEMKKKLEELKAQVKAKLEELKKAQEEKSAEEQKKDEERKAKIEETKASVSNLVDSVKNLVK